MERFCALVLSHDDETLKIINRAFETYSLRTNVVRSVTHANELLKRQRFDLAICDYDLPGAHQFTYLSPTNGWRGTILAVVRQDQLAHAIGHRIHVTSSKPLTPGLLRRGLRAAYSSMLFERRAVFRHPVLLDASWAKVSSSGEQRDVKGLKIHNVSRHGMCVECADELPQRATLHLAFELPERGGLVNIESQVVWSKPPGRAGLKFRRLSAVSQERLAHWLDSKLPEFAEPPLDQTL